MNNFNSNFTKIDEFTRGYIVCALWSSNDDNDNPLDSNYKFSDISEETMLKMIEHCRVFQKENEKDLKEFYTIYKPSRGGHDFWLSRCGHGSGFFDENDVDESVLKRLQEAAQKYKNVDLYVGDDGKVYA